MTKRERHLLVALLSLTSALLTYGVTRIFFPDMPTAFDLARTHYVNVQVGLSTTAGILVSLFLAMLLFAAAIKAELVPNGVSPPGKCANNAATGAESSTCVEMSNEKFFVSRLAPQLYFIIAFGMLSSALLFLFGPVKIPGDTGDPAKNKKSKRHSKGIRGVVEQTQEKYSRCRRWHQENFSLGVHHDHIGRWFFHKLFILEVGEVGIQCLTL